MLKWNLENVKKPITCRPGRRALEAEAGAQGRSPEAPPARTAGGPWPKGQGLRRQWNQCELWTFFLSMIQDHEKSNMLAKARSRSCVKNDLQVWGAEAGGAT